MAENMSKPPSGESAAYERGHTATRLQYVAPPGLQDAPESAESIGRYEILERLGKGAMGVVYKARDPLLDRVVAVKTIMSPRRGGERVRKAFLERFHREAKAAAKMQHPSIVTIFDVGTHNGAPFMVLEYLPGESLADRLDRFRMPLPRVVQISVDLASALAFAHKTRIVHRDVKPANVLSAGDDRWKLADFGIARLPDSDLTQIGIFMGTPGYSPPEAIQEGRYTPQADVFAWGAVLYELLCGRIPYEGPDTATTNSKVMDALAPPPSQYDASIPVPLVEVCMRALNPDQGERYTNGAEAEHALRKAWESCLTSSLVSPAVLAAKEVPHGEASKTFHKMASSIDTLANPTPLSIADPEPSRTAPSVLSEDTITTVRADSSDDLTVRVPLSEIAAADIADIDDDESTIRQDAAVDGLADALEPAGIPSIEPGGTHPLVWVVTIALALAIGILGAFVIITLV